MIVFPLTRNLPPCNLDAPGLQALRANIWSPFYRGMIHSGKWILVKGEGCASVIPSKAPNYTVIYGLAALLAVFLIIVSRFLILKCQESSKVNKSLTIKGYRHLNKDGEYVTISWLNVFICLVLFRSIRACTSLMDLQSFDDYYHYLSHSGSIACFGNQSIITPYDITLFDLSLMYETGSYNHYCSMTWGCSGVGGTCPWPDDCVVRKPFMIDDTINLSFCFLYPSHCFAGIGCLHGDLELKLKEPLKVYEVANAQEKDRSIIEGLTCEGYHDPIPPGQPVVSYVVTSGKRVWACNFVSPRGSPIKGQVGEIQIVANKIIVADLLEKPTWETAECQYDLVDIDKVCKPLPAIVVGHEMSYNGMLIQKKSVIVRTQVHCSSKPVHHEQNCSLELLDIEGVRESGYGVSIVAKAHSPTGSTMVIKINCNPDLTIVLPCDSKLHYYHLSETLMCTGIKDSTIMASGFGDTEFVSSMDRVAVGIHERSLELAAGMSSGFLVIVACMIICIIRR